MAIDTKAKRASVQAYALGIMRPPPSGTIGVGARATLSWVYSGLAYANAPTVPDIFIAGLRVTVNGQLVYEDAVAVAASNGNPLTANGRFAISTTP